MIIGGEEARKMLAKGSKVSRVSKVSQVSKVKVGVERAGVV